MVAIERPLYSKNQTGREMYRIIETFAGDLYGIETVIRGNVTPFPFLSLTDAFYAISNIPYLEDTAPVEIVSRPAYINDLPGADCKKKAIMMSSYLKLNKVPYRLVAISEMPDKHVHHVFTQANLNGTWFNLDPTYENAIPFQHKTVTKYEVLRR